MKALENSDLNLPDGLLAQVRAAAQEERRPSNEVIREAIERYLEDREWQKIYAYGEARSRALGLVETDVERLIDEHRAENRKSG